MKILKAGMQAPGSRLGAEPWEFVVIKNRKTLDKFEKMDNYIWIKVKKFLKHLHPKKGWKWIRRKYFPDPKPEDKHQDRWILTDPVSGRQLVKMRWTNIDKRHIMIKHNYSPFDSDKSEYFKNRQIKLSN